MGPLVATIVRLIVPLFILRWPLGGLIASVVADTLDVVIIAVFRSGMFEDYTSADKLLDTYMLAFAALVSLRWHNRIARLASLALFGYRVMGVAILQVTDARWVLFLFPSVFDFFFVYHLVTTRWFPALEVNGYRRLAYVLLILSGMKLVQEFLLHMVEFRPLCWINLSISELVGTGPGSLVVNSSQRMDEVKGACFAPGQPSLGVGARVRSGSRIPRTGYGARIPSLVQPRFAGHASSGDGN